LNPPTFDFFDVGLTFDSDDASLAGEFQSIFGEGSGGQGRRAFLKVTLRGDVLTISGDALDDPAAFLAGFSSPDIPLTLAAPNAVCIAGEAEPMFVFDGEVCRFQRRPKWQRVISHMIFLRLIRLRPDLLFFHAASVGISNRAFLFIGPKGHGKTTISMALAARGHAFLGDETAIVEPSTSLVHPFRRPVSIKAGPSSAVVAAAMRGATFGDDGMVRLPIANVMPVAAAVPLPIGGVVFLQPFAGDTRVERITAGREELSLMQPLASSLSAGASTQRVFAMIRLLNATKCFKLWPSQPDLTAIELEKVLSDEAHGE
jgi:hypothetical protein